MAGFRRFATAIRRFDHRHPSFSSAAALELDYDSDWEDLHLPRGGVAMADACGSRLGRGVQWIFIGVQKHLYASRISELLGVPHISMGSLVRQELSPRSSLYHQIANAVNEGKLVPEDIIFALLSKRLEEGYRRGESGFILDGIPRTRFQAEILEQIADIDLVVNFKCMGDCLEKEKFGSSICSICRKPYHLNNSESSTSNPCLATRSWHDQLDCSSMGDRQRTREEKFQFYREQNQSLEDYYRKQMKLLNFQVAKGPAETWQGLLAALHLQPAGDGGSRQTLTP